MKLISIQTFPIPEHHLIEQQLLCLDLVLHNQYCPIYHLGKLRLILGDMMLWVTPIPLSSLLWTTIVVMWFICICQWY